MPESSSAVLLDDISAYGAREGGLAAAGAPGPPCRDVRPGFVRTGHARLGMLNYQHPLPLPVSTRVSSFSIPLPASGSRACLCLSTVSLLLRFVLLLLHHRLSLSSFLYFFTLVNRYEPCSSMTTLVVLSHLSS